MPKQTIQQRLIAYFAAQGYEAEHKKMAGKCVVMTHKLAAHKWYLGPSGSCRYGKTRTTSRAISQYEITAMIGDVN